MSTATSTKTFADIPANRDRLFLAACFALIVTSMTFAIRAGILGDLAADFELTDGQLGWVNSMAFYGFPVAMLVGGAIYIILQIAVFGKTAVEVTRALSG